MASWAERQRKQFEEFEKEQKRVQSGPVRKAPTKAVQQILNPRDEGYENWSVDRAEREKKSALDAALGLPSRDRMVLDFGPSYKEPKTTQPWQKAYLKDLPIKKYGRSYNAKFENWAREQGVPDNMHFQFKQWLNAQDQGLKSDAWEATEGQRAKNVDIAKAKEEAERKREESKREREEALKEEISKPKEDKGGLFGFLANIDKKANEKLKGSTMDRLVNRSFNTMSGNANQEFFKQLIAEGPKKGKEREYEEMVQQYEDRFGGDTSALDTVADLSGYLAPGAAAYKGVKAVGLGAKGLTKAPSLRNAGQLAKEGALAGGVLGGAEVAIREGINPDNYDWKDNLAHIGINTAAGAALDPVLSMALPVMRQLSRKAAAEAMEAATRGQTDRLAQIFKREGVDPSVIDPLFNTGGRVPESQAAQILSGQAELPSTRNVQNPLGQLEELTPRVSQRQALQELTQVPDRVRLRSPEVQRPSLDPDTPFEKKMEYWKDKNNPITENDVVEIRSKIEELHGELNTFHENAPQLRQMEIQTNPKLQERMAELTQKIEGEVNAKQEWEATKEIHDLYKQKSFRPEWMNINLGHFRSIPEEFKNIPTRFRHRVNNSADVNPQYRHAFGLDPYEAMERAGFDDMEAFIGHLQNIDDKLRVKLKDLQTTSAKDSRSAFDELEQLEREIDANVMKKYGIDEVQNMYNELLPLSNPREGKAADPFENVRKILINRDQPTASTVQEAPLRSDPYGEGLDDNLIEQLIARRNQPRVEEPQLSEHEQLAEVLGDPTASDRLPDELEPMGITAGKIETPTPFAKEKGRVGNFVEKHGTPKELAEKVRTELDSSLQPVKNLEKQLIKEHGDKLGKLLPDGTLSKEDSLAKSIQMRAYSHAKAIKSFEKDEVPRQKLLAKYNITNRAADDFNLAMHARDIYANERVKVERIGEIKAELEAIESQFGDPKRREALEKQEQKLLDELDELAPYELPEVADEEWVADILKRYGDNKAMQKQQKMYVNAQRKNLEMLKKANIITDSVEEGLIKKYPNYVSLAREVPKETRSGKGSPNAKNPLGQRKLGSRELPIRNLRESAAKNRIAAVSAIDQNRIINIIENMSQVSDLKGMFQKVTPHDTDFTKVGDQIVQGYDKNGKTVYYKVPPVVKEMMEQLPKESSKIVEMMQGSAQLFKNLTTSWNPKFHIKALVRDTPQMMAASNTNAHVGHMMMGFMDAFFGKGLSKVTGGRFKSYREMFEDMGGDYSTLVSQDPAAVQKYMKSLQAGKFQGMQVFNPLNHMKEFGQRTEIVARLGEMHSAKGRGYSDEDAFFEAINLLDYKDQGTLTRSLNKVSPYLAPTIRGNVRTVEAMKKPQFWATGTGLITVPTLVNYAMRYSDTTSDLQRDKINNLPTWAKNTMWAFPVPNSEKIILYPKPFVLGQMFANPVERVLDKAFADTERPVKDIMSETGMDMFQTMIPSVSIVGLTGVWQMQANQRFFTGMPIEDSTMQNEPDKTERYNMYTSEVAKKVGKATGQSPAVIDSLLKGQLGTMGTQGLDVLDNYLARDGSRPAKIQTNAEILNPLGNFIYKDTSASGLYDRVTQQARRDDKEQTSKLPEGTTRRPKGYERTTAQEIKEYLSETNKEIKAIREDLKMTPKQKSEKISKIRDDQKRKAAEIMKPSRK